LPFIFSYGSKSIFYGFTNYTKTQTTLLKIYLFKIKKMKMKGVVSNPPDTLTKYFSYYMLESVFFFLKNLIF